MLKIRPITCACAFVFCGAIFNLYEDASLSSWRNLAIGILAGLPVMTCYFSSPGVRIAIAILSICVFSSALVGILNGIQLDRVFFSGVSIGVIAGWLPAFLLAGTKGCAVDFLIKCARTDDYSDLAQKLEQRFRK